MARVSTTPKHGRTTRPTSRSALHRLEIAAATLLLGGSALAVLVPASPAAADGVPVNAAAETYTANAQCYQTYQVPAGVTKVQVDAIGQPGQPGQSNTYNASGDDPIAGGAAGLGSEVTANVNVTPGATLYVNVGEEGMPGGYGGEAGNLTETQYVNPGNGGNGGGAAWVTPIDPTAAGGCAPAAPLVVAAGGGGGGGAGSNIDYGPGGSGGSEEGSAATPGGFNASDDGGPGLAATATGGGHGGSGGYGTEEVGFPSFVAQCGTGYAGFNGFGDTGGQGGFASQDPQEDSGCGANGAGGYAGGNSSGGGGGGGGGYYGGGGGGGADDYRAGGGGGGAGVSYIAGAGSIAVAGQFSTPSVTITPLTSTPKFVGTTALSCTVGLQCEAPVTTTGYPTPEIGYAVGSANLPDGLTLYDNGNGTADVEGDPDGTQIGTYDVTFEAANQDGDSSTQTYAVTVGYGPLSSVSLNPTTWPPLLAGVGSLDLSLESHYQSGFQQDVTSTATWSSSPTGVVSVTSDGVVSALAPGTTTVTGSFQGKTAQISLTVQLGDAIQITVTPSDPTVGIGQSQQYTATAHYYGGSTADVTNSVAWSTEADGGAQATVSPTGLATASPTAEDSLNEGFIVATLTNPDATTVSGDASMTATLAHPTSVAVNAANPNLASGASESLTATGTYPGGGTADVTSLATWSSSNPSLATVDDLGSVSAVANTAGGTVTITATGPDGVASGSTTLTILPGVPTSITVTPASPTIGLGQTQQMTATAHYLGGATSDVTSDVAWSSDYPGVVSISPTGLATGTGTDQGELADLRATLNGYGSAATQATLTLAHPTSIAISPLAASLPRNWTQAYTAIGTFPGGATADISNDVTWSTGSGAVATFSDNDLHTNSSGGNSTSVTATSEDTLASASTTVTVLVGDPTSLTVAITPGTIGLGTSVQATATAHYSDGSTSDATGLVTWQSLSPAVASVSATGLVTALATTEGAGATINATLTMPDTSQVTGSGGVTVTLAHPVSIAVGPTGVSLEPGGLQQFSATGTYPGGATANITNDVYWTSSNTSLLSGGSGNQFEGGNTAGTASAVATSGDHAVSGSASVTLDGLVAEHGPSTDSTAVDGSYTSAPFTATGGSGQYTWSLTGAPAGLALSSTTGSSVTITGTPTAITNGNPLHLGVTVTDQNDQYNSDNTAQLLLTVTPLPETIDFAPLPSSALTGTSVPLVATGGGSSSAVRFSTTSPSCGVGGPTNTTLYFEGAGTCVVSANQYGDSVYAAAPQVQQTITLLYPQVLAWNFSPPTGVVVGSEPYAATVQYQVSSSPVIDSIDPATTNGACTLSNGAEVNFVHAGTCVVDANEAAAPNYAAANQIQQTIQVGQLAQSVHFTSGAPTGAAAGGATYTPAATGTASGNPVAITVDGSTTNAACAISAGKVSFAHVGTCVLDANQSSSNDYAAAPQAQQSFQVHQGTQQVHITSSAPTGPVPGDPAYVLSATGGGSGNPVTYGVDASTTNDACFVISGQVYFLSGGSCVIDANQAGNADYSAAPQVRQTIVVRTVQVAITSAPFSAGASSSPGTAFTVSLVDGSGHPTTSDSATTIGLYSTSSGAVFGAASDDASSQTLLIPAGTSSVTGYYGDTAAGSPTIVAYDAAGNFGAGNQVETVTGGAVASLAFAQQPSDAAAGQAMSPGTVVQATDQWGNPVAGATVTLAPDHGSIVADESETTDSNGDASFDSLAIADAGSYTLVASSGSATSDPSSAFQVYAPLVVGDVEPASGTADGGTDVTIVGSGFNGAQAVDFGGVPATSFTVLSDSVIDATSPAASPGPVDVVVANDAEASGTSAADVFDYVTPAPTKTTAWSSAGTVAVGAKVTFKAHVTGTPASFGVPTGSVTFSDAGTVLGTAPLGALGYASLQTAALPAGSDQVTATYDGDANYGISTSPAVDESVLGPSHTAITATPNPATLGAKVTLKAHVTGAPQAYGTPTGTVTFLDAGTPHRLGDARRARLHVHHDDEPPARVGSRHRRLRRRRDLLGLELARPRRRGPLGGQGDAQLVEGPVGARHAGHLQGARDRLAPVLRHPDRHGGLHLRRDDAVHRHARQPRLRVVHRPGSRPRRGLGRGHRRLRGRRQLRAGRLGAARPDGPRPRQRDRHPVGEPDDRGRHGHGLDPGVAGRGRRWHADGHRAAEVGLDLPRHAHARRQRGGLDRRAHVRGRRGEPAAHGHLRRRRHLRRGDLAHGHLARAGPDGDLPLRVRFAVGPR